MLDIPLNLVLIKPEIDILIFILIVYLLSSKYLFEIMEKDLGKIFWMDIKITIILLCLGYVNYSGMEFDFFGLKFYWFVYIIIIQFVMEILLIIPYKNKFIGSSSSER